MLTLPSEPLPQTVLMEPLPSIPPSFMSYGLTGSRRSPRKHHVTERRAAPKPYTKPSAPTRPRPPTHTAPVPHSVPSRLERSPLKQPPIQEQLDFSVSTKSFCDTLTRPQISSHKLQAAPPTNPALDRHVCATPAPPDACSFLAPDATPRGWVIGPLFQSFKSKMASFTEIVMSPFKSNGGGDDSEPCSENTTGDGYVTAEDGRTPERRDTPEEAAATLDNSDAKLENKNVPLRTPNAELETSVTQSAWNSTSATSAAKIFDVAEEESASRSVKARKWPSKTTPKAKDVGGIHTLKEMHCEASNDMEMKQTGDLTLKDELGENQADRTPTSPSVLEEASLRKVKRTLDLSGDTSKRKKPGAKTEEKKQKPNTVTKKITRSNHKKSKVEREEVVLTVCNESSVENVAGVRASDDTKGTKAKAKIVRSTKTKDEPMNALDTTQMERSAIASKKRKAKDNVCTSSSEEAAKVKGQSGEERGKTGRRLKKIKAEVEADTGSRVYFELTPSESEVRQASVWDNAADCEKEAPKRRARRMDPQRRRCRAIHATKSPTTRRPDDVMTRDDSEVFQKGVSTRLLRSVSCPEIPTLRLQETPWTPHFHSPPRSRSQPPQHAAPHNHASTSSLAHHFHKSARRTRRHTVCSMEVEREIAPLCLRKEVYPARRSPSPYDPQHLSPMRALSPGASLSALASCFLSSPLAFLSKKSEGSVCSSSHSPAARALSPNLVALRALSPAARSLSPATRSLSPAARSLSPAARSLSPAACSLSPATRAVSPAIAPPTPPTLTSLLGTSLGQLPGFHLRTDTLLNASSDSSNSGVGVGLLGCAADQPSAPEEDEDTCSSSPESEELREETTHSDSELKVLKKDHGQRKVSSIKIRKALPKPQNNLTPMGLPKAVRVKKKEFSLEEIYTNKNFSKPPESRLETIFEMPMSRKNGSESWCGPRRVKRFLEFPELGEARRSRKPPVGAAKANSANSRPRRGGCREDPALGSDPDSVLCAKLEQLGAWLRQNDC